MSKKAKLKCRVMGCSLPIGDYAEIKVGVIDGIGREHAYIYQRCESCETSTLICKIHLPARQKEKDLEQRNRELVEALTELRGFLGPITPVGISKALDEAFRDKYKMVNELLSKHSAAPAGQKGGEK